MPYLLDTNVFIEAKNRYYGFEFCPAFWDWLLLANTDGRVFSIDHIGDEILAGDDELTNCLGSGTWRKLVSKNYTEIASNAQFCG